MIKCSSFTLRNVIDEFDWCFSFNRLTSQHSFDVNLCFVKDIDEDSFDPDTQGRHHSVYLYDKYED